MATSNFFNNIGASAEQSLHADLIIEAIKIFGIDFYYVTRRQNSIDPFYLEDDQSSYDQAHMLEMYVKNWDGFEGDGSLMSKFGLEIQDRMTFTMARRSFDTEIGERIGLVRPREGDLIYYMPNNKLFRIEYVEDKPIHFALGALPSYDISCELFKYSNEQFNTGIPEIDSIQKNLSTNIYDYALLTDEGKVLVTNDGQVLVSTAYEYNVLDPIENNTEISQGASDIIDFSETNPFGEIE